MNKTTEALKRLWCSIKGHGNLVFDKNKVGIRVIDSDPWGIFVKVKCDKCGKEYFL